MQSPAVEAGARGASRFGDAGELRNFALMREHARRLARGRRMVATMLKSVVVVEGGAHSTRSKVDRKAPGTKNRDGLRYND
jgi:hypothetical protein